MANTNERWEAIQNECETCIEQYTTSETVTCLFPRSVGFRPHVSLQMRVYSIQERARHMDCFAIVRSIVRGIIDSQGNFADANSLNSLPCFFRLPHHDAIMVIQRRAPLGCERHRIDEIQFQYGSIYRTTPFELVSHEDVHVDIVFSNGLAYACRLFVPDGHSITSENMLHCFDIPLRFLCTCFNGTLHIHGIPGQQDLTSLFSAHVWKSCFEYLRCVYFENVAISKQQMEMLQTCQFNVTFTNVTGLSTSFMQHAWAWAIHCNDQLSASLLEAISSRWECNCIPRLHLTGPALPTDKDALQSLMLALHRVRYAFLGSLQFPMTIEIWSFIWKSIQSNGVLQVISFTMFDTRQPALTLDFLRPIRACLQENNALFQIHGMYLDDDATTYWKAEIQPLLDANRDSRFPPLFLRPDANANSHRAVVMAALVRYEPHIGKRFKLLRKYVDLFFPVVESDIQ